MAKKKSYVDKDFEEQSLFNFGIEQLSANPIVGDSFKSRIFYNTTADKLKYYTDSWQIIASEAYVNTALDTPIKITSNDTTPAVLDSKLTVQSRLKKTIINPGGNESIDLDLGNNLYGGSEIVVFSATPEFDFDNGNSQQITVTADITSWSVTNQVVGASYVIYFKQDATGGWVIPDPTGITYDISTLVFDTSADAINIVNVIVMPDGSTIWDLVKIINP